MDSDAWARISNSYRRFHARLDAHHIEEHEAEEELREEFVCPFCAENYDMVGLCCHIDEEHAMEAKNGLCPICGKKVGSDLVCHMTVQHGSLLKQVKPRRRLRKGISSLSFSSLRKDLREGKLQALLGGSSSYVPSSQSEPDPLVTSFIYNPPVIDESPRPSVETLSSVEAKLPGGSTTETLAHRAVQQLPLSEEDEKEAAQRSKFVQGLLLSTFLSD